MKLIPVDSHDELLQLIVAIARSSHTGQEFERALNREFTRELICEIPSVAHAPSPPAPRQVAAQEPDTGGSAILGDRTEVEDGSGDVSKS